MRRLLVEKIGKTLLVLTSMIIGFCFITADNSEAVTYTAPIVAYCSSGYYPTYGLCYAVKTHYMSLNCSTGVAEVLDTNDHNFYSFGWYAPECSGSCPVGKVWYNDGFTDYGFLSVSQFKALCSPPPPQCWPTDEICNGKDDDCDGQVDEGIAPASCYSGPEGTQAVGTCKSGKKYCFGGQWTICIGEALPQPEVCDGKDNDCNFLTDEDIAPESCYTGPAGTLNVGQCKAGTKTCQNAAWSACSGEVVPQNEICDNIDNDCDWQADEDVVEECYTGPDGTKNVGQCKAGVQSCSSGQWSTCVGEAFPSDEVCDGKDNNCDGKTEDFSVEVTPNIVPPEVPQLPGQDTSATVLIKLIDPPSDICYIHLSVIPEPDSGGHDHHSAKRPHGKIGGYDNLMVTISGSEEKKLQYKSSFVSGTERIITEMAYEGSVVKEHEANVDVKVKWLAQMPYHVWGYYNLIGIPFIEPGVESLHFSNHHARTDVVNKMQNIAYGNYLLTGKKLGINDMSLKWGGLFDVKNNWSRPHGTHRLGTDVDVRSSTMTNLEKKKFKDIVCAYGGFPNLEYPGQIGKEHFHLYFKLYLISQYSYCSSQQLQQVN